MRIWVAAFLALVISSPAHADWYEASSDNFVIYADDSEKDVRRFAENLERYHAAMSFVTSRKVEKPSPSNRVTIFAVGSSRDIRKLSGGKDKRIAGFYVPRAGGSRAFVQDIRLKNGYPSFSTVILLHEYAHHFLMSSTRYEMPRWASEGAAEFFAAASFSSDGSVMIGRPAQHRAGDLAFAADVSVEELLDHELYERNKRRGHDAFYAKSWLLYHYLTFSEERRGQLPDYLLRVAKGESSPDAAREAFGDIDKLQGDLNRYLRQRRMMTFALTPERIQIGPVSIRKLPEGEAEMMPLRIRSQRGVTREQAEELIVEVREVAQKYPNDPGVLTALAEAEFDAGNDEAAIAAADAAIAIDPQRKNAYVQKGYALFNQASEAEPEDQVAAYSKAMKPFSALNGLENDHPLPLIYYYRSYVQNDREPPENARHALERASQLAPFDHSLAMNVAMMQAKEGKTKLAAATLKPIAANPHGGGLARTASALVPLLETAEDGEPFAVSQVMRQLAEQLEAQEDDPASGSADTDGDAE